MPCSICLRSKAENLVYKDLKISSRELNLAKELKSHCEPCKWKEKNPQKENKWKEKYPQKSARIFHELGLLYRDKCLDNSKEGLSNKFVTFIQSAALLNCALNRQTLSQKIKKIKKDLQILCANLLKSSEAQQQDFDLVEFASDLKQEIEQWRNELKEKTKLLPVFNEGVGNDKLEKFERKKIKKVKSLQKKITDKYKCFMKKVSEKSIKILGDSPYDFSLVGLGSMARKEITPFSDFESIIVLKDKESCYCKELEYFRWYAVVFQVIVINLGETPLHCIAIPSLNDPNADPENWFLDAFTKRGISFDSMMPYASKNPLGKQPTKNKPFSTELIRPVSEMVKYLTQEQDVKNGYQLSDILTYTCSVAGSEDVYSDFEKKRKDVLKVAKVHTRKEVKDMIKKDMEIHSTKLGISSTIENDSYNLKKLAYRSTTIFITGIAKWHNIEPGSCFELVWKMKNKELIDTRSDFSRKLQYAVALACEIRLKTYLEHGCQWDYAELSEEEGFEDLLKSLTNAVGLRSCYDYFEIALCLQYDAIAYFQLDRSYLFHSCVTMFIAISSLLRMYDHLNTAKTYVTKKKQKYVMQKRPVLPHQPTIDVHNSIDYDEEMMDDPFWSKSDSTRGAILADGNAHINKDSSTYLGFWHGEMQRFYSECFPNERDKSHTTHVPHKQSRTDILLKIARLLFEAGIYVEAEYCFKTALKTLQSTTNSSKKCKEAECFYYAGMCLSRTRKHEDALEKLNKALSIGQSPNEMKYFKGYCNLQIGLCQRHLGKEEEAIKTFESALEIFPRDDVEISEAIAFCLLNLGLCWSNLQKYEDALKQFKILFDFCSSYSNISQASKAMCLYYLGYCLQNLNRYDEAKERLDEAIQIYDNDLQHKERNDADRAKTYIYIGNCFKVMNDKENALKSYFESLKLWQKLHQTFSRDHYGYFQYSKAMAYKRIGSCYQQYNSCEKAIEAFKKSLQFFQNVSYCRKNLTSNLYDLQRSLGGAYRGVEDFESALLCYQKCLDMTDKTTPKKQIADLHRQIGCCFKQMKQPDEAKESSKKAFKIYKELIENEEKNEQSLLECIGFCYMDLGENESARKKFHEFIDICEKSTSSTLLITRTHVASAFKFIGILWNRDDDKDAAKDAFEKSLEILLALPKSLEYEHKIAYLNNQIGDYWLRSAHSAPAHLYSVTDLKNKATSCFEKNVTKSRQKMLLSTSKGTKELARTYKNLGRVLSPPEGRNCDKSLSNQQKQQYLDVITNYEEAKKLFEDMGSKCFAQDIAYLLKNIGIYCQKALDWEKAIQNYWEAVAYECITKGNVKTSNDIAFVKKNIGICYQKQNLHKEAIDIFEESLNDYSKVPDSSTRRSEETFINKMIAKSCEALKQNQAARPFYRQDLRNCQRRTLLHHTPKHGKRQHQRRTFE